MLIGAVSEANRVEAFTAKAFDVGWVVFYVDVCSDLFLVFHETEIPVRDPVVVEPVDGLTDREIMKVVNE